MAFPVGKTKLVERKISEGNPVKVEVGKYVEVGTIKMIPDGIYFATHQIRLPGGYWAKVRFVRVDWPGLAQARDKTGLHPYHPAFDDLAFSDSFTHPLSGGGPLVCEVKVYSTFGPSQKGQTFDLPTSIFKVKRVA